MFLVVLWIVLVVVIGHFAGKRGRSGIGWTLLALALSPLIAGLILALAGENKEKPDRTKPLVEQITPAVYKLPMEQNPVALAAKKLGSKSALARAVNVTPQAIQKWFAHRIPAERVLAVEAATGIPRAKLRPDLFGRKRVA